jgi:hypothetical protein
VKASRHGDTISRASVWRIGERDDQTRNRSDGIVTPRLLARGLRKSIRNCLKRLTPRGWSATARAQ